MDCEMYPTPNDAINAIMVGDPMEDIVLAEAQRAETFYVTKVAKSDIDYDRHLVESTYVESSLESGVHGEYWMARMVVDNDHALPHEFGWTDPKTGVFHPGAHDLDYTLGALAL